MPESYISKDTKYESSVEFLLLEFSVSCSTATASCKEILSDFASLRFSLMFLQIGVFFLYNGDSIYRSVTVFLLAISYQQSFGKKNPKSIKNLYQTVTLQCISSTSWISSIWLLCHFL